MKSRCPSPASRLPQEQDQKLLRAAGSGQREAVLEDRCDEIITMMLNHKGYGYLNIKPDMLEAFVRYEWNSQRWVMLVEPETNAITGWLSWYNFDDDSMELVKKNGLPGCFYQDLDLFPGDNLYLANTVVRSGSSPKVFRMLVSMAKLANRQAKTINAFLWNRESPLWRWRSFSLPKRSIEHGQR